MHCCCNAASSWQSMACIRVISAATWDASAALLMGRILTCMPHTAMRHTALHMTRWDMTCQACSTWTEHRGSSC